MRWSVGICVLMLAACSPPNGAADTGGDADGRVAGDGGDADTCHQFTDEELYAIESAVMDAAPAVAATLDECRFDSDCMNAEIRTACVSGCCVPINTDNEAAYREAEKGISAEQCPEPAGGCGVPVNNADCLCNESRCIEGHCVNASAAGLHRVPVGGTNGFCASYGQAGASCESVADCVAYRVPVEVDCCTGAVSEPDCNLVNVDDVAPDQPECSADTGCDTYPRACENGQCVFTIPSRDCASDAECTKLETECGCMAVSLSADATGLIFGSASGTGVPCADAEVSCVEGTCRLVGEFMDEPIALYCRTAADCGLLGEFTTSECEQMYRKDNYKGAAMSWLVISAAPTVGTQCGGGGPWHYLPMCRIVICP